MLAGDEKFSRIEPGFHGPIGFSAIPPLDLGLEIGRFALRVTCYQRRDVSVERFVEVGLDRFDDEQRGLGQPDDEGGGGGEEDVGTTARAIVFFLIRPLRRREVGRLRLPHDVDVAEGIGCHGVRDVIEAPAKVRRKAQCAPIRRDLGDEGVEAANDLVEHETALIREQRRVLGLNGRDHGEVGRRRFPDHVDRSIGIDRDPSADVSVGDGEAPWIRGGFVLVADGIRAPEVSRELEVGQIRLEADDECRRDVDVIILPGLVSAGCRREIGR